MQWFGGCKHRIWHLQFPILRGGTFQSYANVFWVCGYVNRPCCGRSCSMTLCKCLRGYEFQLVQKAMMSCRELGDCCRFEKWHLVLFHCICAEAFSGILTFSVLYDFVNKLWIVCLYTTWISYCLRLLYLTCRQLVSVCHLKQYSLRDTTQWVLVRCDVVSLCWENVI